MLNKLFSRQDFINKSIIRFFGIKITISKPQDKIYADNIEWYKQNWGNIPNTYVNEYKSLTTGLDDESCFTVSNILKRIRALKRKDFKRKFDFTKQEKDIFTVIQEKLNKQITYLGSQVWAYKDCLLNEGLFEPGIFYYDCYTKCLDNIKYFCNKDIIDAGAYVGDSSLVLSKLTTKNVYAFEPVKKTYESMKKILELNKTQNIIPINMGLGDSITHLPLTSEKSMGASFLNKTEYDIPTEITTLDNFVEQKNIEVGLIKVDIEGFEQLLLKGAYKTICKYKPTLLISIYHNYNDFFEIKPLIESWNLGYKFKIRKAVDNDIVRDTMLICEQ